MSAFTTEAAVRLKFQLTDETAVPTSLVTSAIEDAHAELLRFLAPAYDVTVPEAGVASGETLLAGAHVFRALCGKDALERKRATVGGQRLETDGRFSALMSMASLAEEQAWYTLEPYLARRPALTGAATTDSRPVFGGGPQ